MNQMSFRNSGVVKKHVELIEKLTTDDIDEAEKIMRDHLWSGKSLHARYHLVPDLKRE
jgi:DNA-binding GntR family transcriptional regulator